MEPRDKDNEEGINGLKKLRGEGSVEKQIKKEKVSRWCSVLAALTMLYTRTWVHVPPMTSRIFCL